MIRISLIIPTHNRAASLLRLLGSVARQTADPALWECLVVDNASTDDTAARFAAFAAAHPQLGLRMVREPQPGVSHARNCGVREARAELLAWADDDELLNENFIAAYLDFFDRHPEAEVAGGGVIAEYTAGRPRWMSQYTEIPIANPMDFGPAVRPFPRGRVPGGGNMAFRRAAALRCGGFDPALGRVGRELIGGEENDFFERMRCGGATIWYVPGPLSATSFRPKNLPKTTSAGSVTTSAEASVCGPKSTAASIKPDCSNSANGARRCCSVLPCVPCRRGGSCGCGARFREGFSRSERGKVLRDQGNTNKKPPPFRGSGFDMQ